MNFPFLTVLFIFAIFPRIAMSEKTGVTGRITSIQREIIRHRIAAAGGCNANVCFALDGSGSIPSNAFKMQKDFVIDVASVLQFNDAVEVAAVQYASSVTTINNLSLLSSSFFDSVNDVTQLGGGSSIASGINACSAELLKRKGEALKIVLLGDGRSNMGDAAIAAANLFRQNGGDVCTVAAGFANDAELLKIAGGDSDKVFTLNDFFEVIDVIEAQVRSICGN